MPAFAFRSQLTRRIVVSVWLACVLLAVGLLAMRVDWSGVAAALVSLPATALAVALLWSAVNHLVCSAFDPIGLRFIGARLPAGRAMLTGFIGHAGNLNIGPLLGAIGLRQRLYSRQGLRPIAIALVTAAGMVTNWLGFFLVAGTLVMVSDLELLTAWVPVSEGGLLTAGILVWLTALAWFLICAQATVRSVRLLGRRIVLPSLPMALQQAVLAMMNWLSAAAIVHALLLGKAPYAAVLVAVMLGAVLTMITNIPSGIGVLEAGFFIALGNLVDGQTLLAALLAYRVVYFLLPLALAAAGWLWLEKWLDRERLREAGATEPRAATAQERGRIPSGS